MSSLNYGQHGTIIAAVFAVIAGLGVWFYARHEQTVEADALPYAARIQRVEGDVAFSDDRANNDATEAKPSGPPRRRINLSQKEIGSTHVTSRALRSLLADAILRGSIQTLRST
jgi:hypothetical protein